MKIWDNWGEWKPIATAPKDRSILLCNGSIYGVLYCGSWRYGMRGEPNPDEMAWRCDSSGRYYEPKYWMDLPEPKIDEDLYPDAVKHIKRYK